MEFAIVLPVLLLLVFGIIEFGLLFNRYISVTHAAREGVHVLALTNELDKGQEAAMAAAPDLVSKIDCAGALPVAPATQVTMTCKTTYAFSLFLFTDSIELTSTARMSD